MRKLFFLIALSIILISTGLAQLPPLIDREIFFGDPEIS